jgi:hypothetical protein
MSGPNEPRIPAPLGQGVVKDQLYPKFLAVLAMFLSAGDRRDLVLSWRKCRTRK